MKNHKISVVYNNKQLFWPQLSGSADLRLLHTSAVSGQIRWRMAGYASAGMSLLCSMWLLILLYANLAWLLWWRQQFKRESRTTLDA